MCNSSDCVEREREKEIEFVTNKYYVLHNYASMATAGEATETALVKQSNAK